MQPVIILFAKAPIPGHVKTRLQPVLTPEQAASLHTAFVNDLLTRFRDAGEFNVELHTDIRTDVWSRFGVTTRLQEPGDLGLKMVYSMDAALRRGAARVVVVGTDAPTLPIEHLRALVKNPAEVTLGPAEDGGYYAIGASRVHPEMFQGVTWSHRNTLEETVAACGRCGLKAAIGPSWFDVDEVADFQRLMDCDDLPPYTARWRDENARRKLQSSG